MIPTKIIVTYCFRGRRESGFTNVPRQPSEKAFKGFPAGIRKIRLGIDMSHDDHVQKMNIRICKRRFEISWKYVCDRKKGEKITETTRAKTFKSYYVRNI